MPGASSIHLAVISGDARAVRALLAKDIKPDTRTKNEDAVTPLFAAAFYGRTEVMRMLLDAGADKSAVMKGTWKTFTPIFAACLNDQAEAMAFLAEKGVDIDATIRDERSLLHEAARVNAVKVTKWLLARGQSATRPNKDKQTPLMYAAANGNTDVMNALFEAKAPVSTKDASGAVAMHAAAHGGSVEAMQLLLDHNSKIDPLDARGFSPIFYAADRDDADAVRWLADKGADINRRGEGGKTLLQMMREAKKTKVTTALEKLGAK